MPARIAVLGFLPALLIFVTAQPGCSTTLAMRSSDTVPASEGTVDVAASDNGNTAVSVRVKHLAPAARVAADSTVYVVWIQPRDGESQSVGALVLGNNLEGRLDTVTPHHRFRLQVTPEPSAQAPHPSHPPVFTAEVDSAR